MEGAVLCRLLRADLVVLESWCSDVVIVSLSRNPFSYGLQQPRRILLLPTGTSTERALHTAVRQPIRQDHTAAGTATRELDLLAACEFIEN